MKIKIVFIVGGYKKMNKKIIGILMLGLFLGAVAFPAINGNQINQNRFLNRDINSNDNDLKITMNIQPPHPPIARFTWTPEDPEIGEEITFNASESYAFHRLKIVSYEWDLNEDGDFCDTCDASGMIIICCHNIQDVYDVTLKVTDDAEQTNEITKSIDFRNPPETPIIIGESTININEPYTCSITTVDPDQDNVYYKIDWGAHTTEWLGPYESGRTIIENYTFTHKGNYTIEVKAKDTTGAESDWGTLKLTVARSFIDIESTVKWSFINILLKYLYKFLIITSEI